MNKTLRIPLFVTIGLVYAGCDQFTKSIAKSHLKHGELYSYFGDTVRLQLAHNYGAFLGLGDSLPEPWRNGIWSIGVGVVLFAMLGYALLAKNMDRPTLIALALIFAGGASNLYDRIAYGGYVVDFLNFGIGPLRTGILNVADMGITAGAVIVFISAFRNSKSNSTS